MIFFGDPPKQIFFYSFAPYPLMINGRPLTAGLHFPVVAEVYGFLLVMFFV